MTDHNTDIMGICTMPRLTSLKAVYEFELPEHMKDEILMVMDIYKDSKVDFSSVQITITK